MKIAIAGCGKIAERMAKVIINTEGAELYAVASNTSIEKAEAFKEKFGAKKAYGSYLELCQDGKVELVYVAVVHSAHYEVSKLFMEHKIPVLCEKPVTMNAWQMQELAKISRDNNVFFMEAMWTRVLPSTKKVLKMAQDGVLGDIKMIKASFAFFCPVDETHRLWNHKVGGGALLDTGIYPVSYITFFYGLCPSEIQAISCINESGVDVTTAVLMKYDGDKIGMADCSIGVTTEPTAYIFGTKGKLKMESFHRCVRFTHTDYDTKNEEVYEMPFEIEGFEYELKEAMDCVKAGKRESDIISHSYSISVMEIMDKIREKTGLTYEI